MVDDGSHIKIISTIYFNRRGAVERYVLNYLDGKNLLIRSDDEMLVTSFHSAHSYTQDH